MKKENYRHEPIIVYNKVSDKIYELTKKIIAQELNPIKGYKEILEVQGLKNKFFSANSLVRDITKKMADNVTLGLEYENKLLQVLLNEFLDIEDKAYVKLLIAVTDSTK